MVVYIKFIKEYIQRGDISYYFFTCLLFHQLVNCGYIPLFHQLVNEKLDQSSIPGIAADWQTVDNSVKKSSLIWKLNKIQLFFHV